MAWHASPFANASAGYLGKSTGSGAPGTWTYNLNSIDAILNYSSPSYTGAALKMGAGVLTSAAYTAAHHLGYRMVSGVCPSVGLAGGYIQGGGYSKLTSLHGLGVDNVLKREVITANGSHLHAVPNQNANLYWAISSSGGGTYSVVVSMTARLHRDNAPTGAVKLKITAPYPVSVLVAAIEALWAAIDIAHADEAPIVDTGAFFVSALAGSSATLIMTAPGQSDDSVRGYLRCVIKHLDRHYIEYALNIITSRSYYDHYDRYSGPLPYCAWPAVHIGTSRLIPCTFMQSAAERTALLCFYRALMLSADAAGWVAVILAFKAPASGSVALNTVHPAWRLALALASVYTPWDWRQPLHNTTAGSARHTTTALLEDVIDPQLTALLPQSAPYLNEAHYAHPDLVHQLFEPNLLWLRVIKRAYDPDDVFYAPFGVGSDALTQVDSGQLCRLKLCPVTFIEALRK